MRLGHDASHDRVAACVRRHGFRHFGAAPMPSTPRMPKVKHGANTPKSSTDKTVIKKKSRKPKPWSERRTKDRILPNKSLDEMRDEIRLRCKLRKDDFDPKFDYKYTDERSARIRRKSGKRGNEAYLPPKGWCKLALAVMGKYKNDQWLGKDNGWPVVYHGTRARPTYMHSIVREGFKVKGGKEAAINGEVFGSGIYVTPDPEYAQRYAKKQKLVAAWGDELDIVFACRVKPKKFEKEKSDPPIWRVSDPRHCRPFAILLSGDQQV